MKFIKCILFIELFLFCYGTITWEELKSNCQSKSENSNISPKNEADCTNLLGEIGNFCCFAELTKSGDSSNSEKKKFCISSPKRFDSLDLSSSSKTTTEDSDKNTIEVNGTELSSIASGTIKCAKVSTIKNNCGLAGNSEPSLASHCTGIIFPEALCCLVKAKDSKGNEHKACRRLDDYPSEKEISKKEAPFISQLEEEGYEFISIECGSKLFKVSLIILSLYIFCFLS